MNILRLVYDWPEPWEGLAPGPYELSKAQQKLGHDVLVFCGGGFKNLGKDTKYTSQALPGQKGGSLEVFRFPRALLKLSLFLTTAPSILLGYWWLKITRQSPDLVHGHGHITACFNIYKLLFGWLDKTPYVLHLHVTAAGRKSRLEDGADSPSLGFWTRFWEWPLHKFSDWLGVRVADKVICVSSRVREEVLDYYCADPRKVVVVENGVNTELFTSQTRNQAQEAEYKILYVGALRQRKNVHLLIEALEKLSEHYNLVIVGSGDKEYEQRLRDLADGLAVKERVAFKGYIKYPEIPEIYKQADIFVLPSSYEGLPKVILEALACGVPVLASGFVLEDCVEGLEFLESLQPEAIAKKIMAARQSGFTVDVGKVRNKYSWIAKAKEIDEVYHF